MSLKVNVTVPPQPSVAVGVAHCGAPSAQLIAVGAGNAEITGATLSITLITCEAVDAFPQPSTAVQVRVIV